MLGFPKSVKRTRVTNSMNTTRDIEKRKKRVRRFFQLPLIGPVFRVLNAYAFRGDPRFVCEIAPVSAWRRRVAPNFLYSLTAAILVFFLKETEHSFSGIAISSLPSVLGFGIGVFALIFVIPSSFIQQLEKDREKNKFGPEMLPSDIGYPLAVVATTLFLASVGSFFHPSGFIDFTIGTAYFYSLFLIIELISTIFLVSYRVVMNSRHDSD